MFLINQGLSFIFIAAILLACSPQKNEKKMIEPHVIRLKPGQDLKQPILAFVKQQNIQAGWVATCAGSLTQYAIRFANQPKVDSGNGHFEIVSLSGTLSVNGSHLHISISDSTGKTIGGHLADGCLVYTTAEIVIHETKKYTFTREKDGTTEWEELQVKENK